MFINTIAFSVLSALLSKHVVDACQFDNPEAVSQLDYREIAASNSHIGAIRRSTALPWASRKIAITNVRIFDGYSLQPSRTVFIDNGFIGTYNASDCDDVEVVDGKNGTLLPGLIDAHAHPSNITHLEQLSSYGVTTALLMACFNTDMCQSLQNHTGLTSIPQIGSVPAAAPGSAHGNITIAVDHNDKRLIHNISQVPSWIDQQIASNSTFIKIIAETPDGLSQHELNAVALEASNHNKRTVCHVGASIKALQQAITSRSEQIHHVPLDHLVTQEMTAEMFSHSQISVPTLSIMQAISEKQPHANFSVALHTVREFHEAGVPILAGTDANLVPGLVATVPFGSSLHGELELLVDAGLEPVDALRAATSRAAHYWGMRDRGVIAEGKRADMVLVDGDPTVDITATRKLVKVWIGGVEWTGGLGQF